MVSTVTSVSITGMSELALGMVPLGIVAIASLLFFLSIKEIASCTHRRGSQALAEHLDMAIIPLLLTFLLMFTLRVAETVG